MSSRDRFHGFRTGVRPEVTGRDGYEGRPETYAEITEHRRSIARALELDRLRASIHRCDEGPIT